MPKKTNPEPTVMYLVDYVKFQYNHQLLISAEDAALLTEILGRSNTMSTHYSEAPNFTEGCEVTMSTISMKTVETAQKAAFMGLTTTEYLKGLEDDSTE